MIYNYNRKQLLALWDNTNALLIEDLKSTMKDLINDGNQIRIFTQIEGFPKQDLVLLSTKQDVDLFYKELFF